MNAASKSRFNLSINSTRKWIVVSLACLIMLAFGMWAIGDQSGRPIESLDRSLPSTYTNGCHLPLGEFESLPCFSDRDSGIPTIYVIGDSHAAQWIPGLELGGPSKSLRFRFVTKSGCPFVLLNLNSDCDLWISNVLRDIDKNRPNLVIISNLTNGKYLNFYDEDSYASFWMLRFGPLLQKTSKLANILIIEDTPYSSFDTSECLVTRSQGDCNFRFNQTQLTKKIRSYAIENNFYYKSFNERLCLKSVCKSGDSKINYYRDENHISVSLSTRFGPSLQRYLKGLIARS